MEKTEDDENGDISRAGLEHFHVDLVRFTRDKKELSHNTYEFSSPQPTSGDSDSESEAEDEPVELNEETWSAFICYNFKSERITYGQYCEFMKNPTPKYLPYACEVIRPSIRMIRHLTHLAETRGMWIASDEVDYATGDHTLYDDIQKFLSNRDHPQIPESYQITQYEEDYKRHMDIFLDSARENQVYETIVCNITEGESFNLTVRIGRTRMYCTDLKLPPARIKMACQKVLSKIPPEYRNSHEVKKWLFKQSNFHSLVEYEYHMSKRRISDATRHQIKYTMKEYLKQIRSIINSIDIAIERGRIRL